MKQNFRFLAKASFWFHLPAFLVVVFYQGSGYSAIAGGVVNVLLGVSLVVPPALPAQSHSISPLIPPFIISHCNPLVTPRHHPKQGRNHGIPGRIRHIATVFGALGFLWAAVLVLSLFYVRTTAHHRSPTPI